MTGLGLAGAAKPTEIQASFRTGWVRYVRVALSSAGGVAVVIALFELLQRQPADGFRLLAVWGPWPLVVLVALGILGKFLSRLNDSLQTTFSAVVEGSRESAAAHTQTAQAVSTLAEATTRLANQGGESAQEVRRLAIFAAQEFPSVYARLDRIDDAVAGTHRSVKELLHRAGNERGSDGEHN